jgi:hypothetical protein
VAGHSEATDAERSEPTATPIEGGGSG